MKFAIVSTVLSLVGVLLSLAAMFVAASAEVADTNAPAFLISTNSEPIRVMRVRDGFTNEQAWGYFSNWYSTNFSRMR